MSFVPTSICAQWTHMKLRRLATFLFAHAKIFIAFHSLSTFYDDTTVHANVAAGILHSLPITLSFGWEIEKPKCILPHTQWETNWKCFVRMWTVFALHRAFVRFFGCGALHFATICRWQWRTATEQPPNGDTQRTHTLRCTHNSRNVCVMQRMRINLISSFNICRWLPLSHPDFAGRLRQLVNGFIWSFVHQQSISYSSCACELCAHPSSNHRL